MTPPADPVAARWAAVRARVAAAAERAGRDPAAVRIVAATKTVPAERLAALVAAGCVDLGENRAQELLAKAPGRPDVTWHFIGHLQRNKAKDVVLARATVETVDSERLATELDKRAGAAGVPVPVLVQVNVAREPQKSGCDPDAVAALIAHVRSLSGLELRGLMTIPPHDDDPERIRPHFSALRALRARHLDPGAWLSMGMSADLEVAVAEGATHVRVGTAIFGARN